MELLKPTSDYVFKRIFGHSGNEKITEGLLSAILEKPVTNVCLDTNPILEKDLLDDKFGVLDIKAKIGDESICDIEMQQVDKYNIVKRILYYWAELYSKSINCGDDYKKLKKTIVILFADFELKEFKSIKKYLTEWQIREKDYVNYVLTDIFQLFIIDLTKVTKFRKNSEMDSWVDFIKKPEVIDMSDEKNSEALREAKKVLEDISQDEREQYLQHLRQKYIMDMKSIKNGSFNEGLESGIKKGTKQNLEKIVLNMYNKNISVEDIAEFTDEKIDKIKKIIEKSNK